MGRLKRLGGGQANVGAWYLAQIAPLISTFPSSVNWRQRGLRLNAPLGVAPKAGLEETAGDPDCAVVLADLDPELHGLPLGLPARVFGKRRLGNGASRAILVTGVVGRRTRTSGAPGGDKRREERATKSIDKLIE
jgi:hypothetical protein